MTDKFIILEKTASKEVHDMILAIMEFLGMDVDQIVKSIDEAKK